MILPVDHTTFSRNALQALIDAMPVGIAIWDADFKLYARNQRVIDQLQVPKRLRKIGSTFEEHALYWADRGLYGPGDRHELVQKQKNGMLALFRKYGESRTEVGISQDIVFEFVAKPLPGGGFIALYTDITERRRKDEKIHELAFYDTLTKVANRTLFYEHFGRTLVEAKRYKHRFAILLIDLDLFKHVNDTYGHLAGDSVLIETARRIKASLRKSDILARLGGDEFVVLLPEVSVAPDVAKSVSEKIMNTCSEPIKVEGVDGGVVVTVGASVGIAHFPDDGETEQELFKMADEQMYLAKRR